jgi:hypothetical protein
MKSKIFNKNAVKGGKYSISEVSKIDQTESEHY